MEFLFKNLSSEDFEELAQDLLSLVFHANFERFKRGKDGGIDLRLLQGSSNTIVQVKHILGSYGAAHKLGLKKLVLPINYRD